MHGPSPKKYRFAASRELEEAAPGPVASRAEAPAPELHQPVHRPVAPSVPGQQEEAGDSNEAGDGGGPRPPGAAPEPRAVTDAAKAFRELRVRPAHSGSDRGAADRAPPSPQKKRKATSGLDKEFILKDDKVKRATDAQGDIAAARGPLGQLLFEFSQIELNRDLLEAIKRTESKTGRLGRAASSSALDRPAFEAVVAEACELLQAHLATVEAHTESGTRRGAILRSYAAIAAFADESDSDSELEEEEEEKGGEGEEGERAEQRRGPRDRPGAAAAEPAGAADSDGEGAGLGALAGRGGSPLSRSPSAAALHSPPRGALQHLPAGSAAGERASSSVLPDAPPDSALEDTAGMAGMQQPRGQAPPPGGGVASVAGSAQHSGRGQGARGRGGGRGPGLSDGSEMAPCSSGHDAAMGVPSDATPEDMVRACGVGEQCAECGWQRAWGPGQPACCVPPAWGGGCRAPPPRRACQVRSPAPVDSRPEPPSLEMLHLHTQPRAQHPRQVQYTQQEAAGPGPGAEAEPWPHPQQAAAAAGPGAEAGPWPHPQQAAATAGPGAEAGPWLHPQQAAAAAGPGAEAEARAPREGPHVGAAPRPPRPHHGLQTKREASGVAGADSSGRTGSGPAAGEHAKRQRKGSGLLGPPLQRLAGVAEAPPPAGFGDELEEEEEEGEEEGEGATTGGLRRRLALSPEAAPRPAAEAAGRSPGGVGAAADAPGAAADAGAASGAGVPAAGAVPEAAAPEPQEQREPNNASEATRRAGGRGPAHQPSASSVWGSTLVCADLTVNDVASQYWPFLRSAMRGQAPELHEDDRELIQALVGALSEAIAAAYAARAGGGGGGRRPSGARPSPDLKSLAAATAFDDLFRDRCAAESPGASGSRGGG
eukprot:scaffold16.g55.t1